MKPRLIFSIVCMVFLAASCKKILDKRPKDFMDPKGFYETQDQLEQALAGVYDVLGTNQIFGRYHQYFYGWEGDEAYFRGNATFRIVSYDFSSGDSYLDNFWSACYTGINRANVLIANVNNNTSIASEFRSRVEGEARFLRAYLYFLLVQNFGGVPLRTTPTVSAYESDMERSSVKDMYEFISSEMIAAEAAVSPIRQLGYPGRVNKSAVRGMLAKVYLYMAGYPLRDESKWMDARNWSKKVIDDVEANHDLLAHYPQFFINLAQDKYDVSESLWEVEFYGNGSGAFNETGTVGWTTGVSSSNPETGESSGYLRITKKLYQLYEPGDERKFWNIGHFSYASSGPSGTKTFLGASSFTVPKLYTLSAAKFRREFETVTPKERNTTPENWPLLRFSDVLLMYAEAENELNGPTASAIEAVNRVRERSWSTGIRSITVTNGGSGYSSAPQVNISGNGGAEAVAVVNGSGQVTAINMVQDAVTGYVDGSYSSVPLITLSGGGGSGATAEASIFSISDADVPASATASKDSFRSFIQDERSRELCFEEQRKFDLLRWGIFSETMQDLGNTIRQDVPSANYAQYFLNAADPRHLLWPIPAAEIILNHKMTQNPNWN